jgi:tripartite-type tricarboxylate transporter receptor subunit TctC
MSVPSAANVSARNPVSHRSLPCKRTSSLVSANLLITHPSLPPKTVKAFVAFAKQFPGKLNYSSSGSGSAHHLSGEMLKVMAGIGIVKNPDFNKRLAQLGADPVAESPEFFANHLKGEDRALGAGG